MLRCRHYPTTIARTGTTGDHIYSIRVVVPKTQTPAGLDAATLLDGIYDGDVRADLPKGL